MDVVSIGETMVLFTPETKGLMRYSTQFSSKIAGAETNTLIGLSRLGHSTGWISRVGKDEFGELILASVRGEGVDVSQVKKDENAPTGVFFKEIVNEKVVRIYYYRKDSATSHMIPDDVNEEYISKAKYLYITGITPALSDSCTQSIFHAIKIAKRNNVKIAFDPNIRKKLWTENKARKTLLKISEQADVLLPGINEGKLLFGIDDYEEIAKRFFDLGASLVIVKLSEKGAYYLTENESGLVKGIKVDRVVDPVGAGDGFAAGVLSGLLDGINIKDAVKRGNAVGAMVTTVNGDIEGLPNRDLLWSFLQSSDDVHR
ncbi:sugar kinase [Bacillus smithii]|uniref:sugar kinase n=1 Tax=Bacillus smithii TaxID=1479 RepID=UPI002E22A9A9|nr:sugar kinase [Bacillus smithii]MED1455291.1 sugar kinase [Bacillus smithii]